MDDLIEGFVSLMNTEPGFTGPVNLGNLGEFTILELAEKVIKNVGGKSKLVFHAVPQDDPKQRQPNITLAKDKLNWKPQISLDDGRKRMVDYFQKLLTN